MGARIEILPSLKSASVGNTNEYVLASPVTKSFKRTFDRIVITSAEISLGSTISARSNSASKLFRYSLSTPLRSRVVSINPLRR